MKQDMDRGTSKKDDQVEAKDSYHVKLQDPESIEDLKLRSMTRDASRDSSHPKQVVYLTRLWPGTASSGIIKYYGCSLPRSLTQYCGLVGMGPSVQADMKSHPS
jgi:hypothetical protein